MHVASDIPPTAVPMMQERMSPGEEIRSVLNWNMVTPTPGLGTFVVTTSSLWIFAFRKQRGAFSIRSAQQLPLKDLQYIGEALRTGWLTGDRVQLELKWPEGLGFTMVSRRPADARLFIDAVRSGQHFGGPSGGDSAAALAALGELRRQGLLDDSDWERAKALMLGKRADEQRQAIDLLRQLHGLMEAGVISPGEFNMKKWEILSRRG